MKVFIFVLGMAGIFLSACSHSKQAATISTIPSEVQASLKPPVEARNEPTASIGRVSIIGLVAEPGLYPLDSGGPTTLGSLLKTAGGIISQHPQQRIHVTRSREDGRKVRKTFVVNATRPLDANDPSLDFELKAGDRVAVTDHF